MAALAAFADTEPPAAARSAHVVFIGEQHDNPGHHVRQAAWVSVLTPAALVFEMLTPDQAARVTNEARPSQAALAALLEWEESGWPDFAMYYPIFAAAPKAAVYGAGVTRDQARASMQTDIADIFGQDDAARVGLSEPLPPAQQVARDALQDAAHCGALPKEMLPTMVAIQRLRDASLARATLAAFEETGGPVVVITGNGHARADWGAPRLLRRAAPNVEVFVLGQSEPGSVPEGGFDLIAEAPAVDRDDPCDAFN